MWPPNYWSLLGGHKEKRERERSWSLTPLFRFVVDYRKGLSCNLQQNAGVLLFLEDVYFLWRHNTEISHNFHMWYQCTFYLNIYVVKNELNKHFCVKKNLWFGRPTPGCKILVGREDKRMNNRTTLPTLKDNAATGYHGLVKIELLKCAGLLYNPSADMTWATCTVCNVSHGWLRGQKNEQQKNAPNPKKKQCSCRLSGSLHLQ